MPKWPMRLNVVSDRTTWSISSYSWLTYLPCPALPLQIWPSKSWARRPQVMSQIGRRHVLPTPGISVVVNFIAAQSNAGHPPMGASIAPAAAPVIVPSLEAVPSSMPAPVARLRAWPIVGPSAFCPAWPRQTIASIYTVPTARPFWASMIARTIAFVPIASLSRSRNTNWLIRFCFFLYFL